MTNAELRQLAEIERRLAEEEPELDRLFVDAAAAHRRRRLRAWWSAAAVTLLTSVGLLVAGLAARLPALAVSAVCPPLAFGVVLLAGRLRYRLAARSRRGHRR